MLFAYFLEGGRVAAATIVTRNERLSVLGSSDDNGRGTRTELAKVSIPDATAAADKWT